MTTLLRFLPDYSASNPYQRMLYRRCSEHDIEARPVTLRELHHLSPTASGGRTVVHVHWTNPIVQSHVDPLDARVSLRSFLADIDRLRHKGVALLWTVHNVLPHDHRHHILELELHQALAERADIVHVLTERTLDATRHFYRLDPRLIMVVPHSTFEGEYPAALPRGAARAQLALSDDALVIAMVGALRHYRGATRLLDALDLLAAEGLQPHLLLGGRAGDDPRITDMLERARSSPRSIVMANALDDDTLAVWMSAADIAAMPYESILNSGSYGLALTFGLPVVAPAAGSFLDEADESFVHLFDRGNTASLVSALRRALDPRTLEARSRAAHRVAAERTPDLMASTFASSLAARLQSLDKRPLD